MRKLSGVLLLVAVMGGTSEADDRLVNALALWDQSCPVPLLDGICGSSTSFPTPDKGTTSGRCGPTSRPVFTLTRRDARTLKQARATLAAAIAEVDKVNATRDGDYARAKLVLIDADFEDYLALALPANLDFDPANRLITARSAKRFAAWQQQNASLARSLITRYETLAALRDPRTTIAASARAGQIWQHFSDALVGAPIPAVLLVGPGAQDRVDAFCDAVVSMAEPLEQQSAAAFAGCLARSSELGWFDDSSKVCERALQHLRPEEFPPLAELHADPGAAPILAIESP